MVKPDIARPIDDISNNSLEIPTLEITNGLLLATIMDNAPSFGEVAFGQTVEIVGTLDEATQQRNPGSLNYKKYGLTDGYYLAKNIKNKANALPDELKDMTVPCCVTMESGAVEIYQNRNNVTVRRYISKGSRQ